MGLLAQAALALTGEQSDHHASRRDPAKGATSSASVMDVACGRATSVTLTQGLIFTAQFGW